MRALVYRCPNTGHQVHGLVDDDLVNEDVSYMIPKKETR